ALIRGFPAKAHSWHYNLLTCQLIVDTIFARLFLGTAQRMRSGTPLVHPGTPYTINRRQTMKVLRMGAAALVAASLSGYAVADTVKVGIIAPFSGPFAHYGKLFKDGAESYVKQQQGKFAGHDIEIIYRDSAGPNPGGVKTAAQELIVNDKVDYLGGFVFTPNAMAVAPLIQQSKTPAVVFNAATSSITTKSDYFVRSSYTLWQVTVPLAKWAHDKGLKKVVTAVMDYAPGVDGEKAFDTEFTRLGGEVVDR